MTTQHGITANTDDRIVLDAGAVYRDYGESGQELIGATRGGAEFTVEREDRDIELDGTKGPVIGLKRTITHMARLTFTLVEVSENTLLDLTRGVSVSDGTHRTVTPDNLIVAADYYTNIALVAEVINTSTPCIIKIINGLFSQGITLTTDDKNEGEWAVTVEGHYTIADLETPPYEVLWPVSAS